MNEPTDLQRFVALYKSFGIDCKIEKHPGANDMQSITLGMRDATRATERFTEDQRFEGYLGHFTEVLFDADGQFYGQAFFNE